MNKFNRPFLTAGLLPLFVVPVWAAGGAYKPWQGSFLWLCLFAWGMFLGEPTRYAGSTHTKRIIWILKDPFVWCAVLLMVFLTIQYLNSGRIQVFDFINNRYTYSPPPHPKLPWSIVPSEALEMVRWFGVVLTVFLILKHSWEELDPKPLIWLVMLNGFMNAMLAFIHLATGWEYMYNLKKFGKDVYGSFGYPNHGALYFILLFAIALGLLLREILQDSFEREKSTFIFAMIWTPIFFLAANLSTNRAGILGAWLTLLLSMLHLAIIAWPRLHPVQRLYGLTGGVIGIGGFAGIFAFVAQPIHLAELRSATVTLNVADEIDGRFFQIESAYHMWVDCHRSG